MRLTRFPAILSLLFITACSAQSTTTAPATEPASITVTVNKTTLTLELAVTEPQHERGLMFRKSMPPDHGMLFTFPAPDNLRFWMKNTYIPLDIIFLDSNAKILLIDPRKPLDETGHGPDSPSQFVVELNAGAADTLHLHTGDTFPLPDNVLKPVSHTDEK